MGGGQRSPNHKSARLSLPPSPELVFLLIIPKHDACRHVQSSYSVIMYLIGYRQVNVYKNNNNFLKNAKINKVLFRISD